MIWTRVVSLLAMMTLAGPVGFASSKTGDEPLKPATKPSPGPERRALNLTVVGEDSQPLPGVSVSVVLATGMNATRRPAELTDDRGRLRVDVSGGPWSYVKISTRKEGYVPIALSWNADQVRAGLPESYRLML